MSKYLYEVCLEGGKNNSDYHHFYKNVIELNAKEPDYAGINNLCLISHHVDSVTIQTLCSHGLQNKKDVTVEEITKDSLGHKNGHHILYNEIIENYFLPFDSYTNLK